MRWSCSASPPPTTISPLAEARLLQFADPGARVDGTLKGSPVVDANMPFGVEHPLSTNTATGGNVTAFIFRGPPLRTGPSVTYSSVLGTAQPTQLRRAFLSNLESERPRPYQPLLNYNSWLDLGGINRFDDGWDNTHTLSGFDSGFPNGFSRAYETAATYHAGIGVGSLLGAATTRRKKSTSPVAGLTDSKSSKMGMRSQNQILQALSTDRSRHDRSLQGQLIQI